MHQSIDNCVQNMGSDENVVSAEKRQLIEELHAPARRKSDRKISRDFGTKLCVKW